MDGALLRPGRSISYMQILHVKYILYNNRFEVQIEVGLPDEEGRSVQNLERVIVWRNMFHIPNINFK